MQFRRHSFQSRSLGKEQPRSRFRTPAKGGLGVSRFYGSTVSRIRRWRRGEHSTRSLFLRAVIGVGALSILYGAFLWFTLPDISDPTSLLASQSTVITDRNGIELYRLFNEEDRTFVPGDSIPLHMKEASISIEDERFYTRGCLDMRAIARAIFKLGRAGGGSTITRQLARNALNLQRENRYQRKIKEFILGCQMESRFTKEELLELYLNWIPFGENAYGIEQAAKRYFNTEAQNLTLAQSAVLASLPQRPSYFSPYGLHVHTEVDDGIHQKIIDGSITSASNIDAQDMTIGLLGAYAGTGSHLLYVGGRTDQVLRNMQDQGFITEAQRLAARLELETIVFEHSREDIRAPHFVLWVRRQVDALFRGSAEEGLLEQGGLRIETTLDWELQQRAEGAVERHHEDLLTRYGGQNMSLLAVDPQTNEILAYVGNMDYNDEEHGGKIDMVQAPRQPGSSFKPFVYASAFLQGYSPATPIYDVPTQIGDDQPQNFDGKFAGLLTMREALGASRNVPAAKAYFLAGEENQILTLVSSLGAPSPLKRKEELQRERGEFDYGWPLALGAAETPLLEMVSAYGAFARGGTYLPTISITRITDKKGNILYQPKAQNPKEALDPRVAYQITSVLSDVSARPEEYWKTQLTVPGFATAAKTGTSNKCLEWKDVSVRDSVSGEIVPGKTRKSCMLRKPDNAWVIGYTPNLVAGVWVGNADSSSMYDRAGGLNTASPIWRDFMASAHRILENPKADFVRPDGLITPQISTLSGEFPTDCTPVNRRRADFFLQERAPSLQDPACAKLTIDQVTQLLASDECPKEAQAEGYFLVAQSVLPQRWPTWEDGVRRWVDEQMQLWNADPTHSGSILPLPVAPTQPCTLALTPGRLEKPTVSIVTPAPDGKATYPTFMPKIKIESKAKILSALYAIDGANVTKVDTSPFTQMLRVPRSIAESGQHELRVTVTDEYFNTAVHSVQFRFEADTSPPQVLLTVPSSDVRIKKGERLTIKAHASDQEGGLKYVQFYLGDVLLTTKPNAPYELIYKITENPGVYSLRVVATDMAGNTSEDVRTITIE